MTIDAYNDNLYVRRREPGHFSERAFYEARTHTHSSKIEENVEYRAICCFKRVHLAIKVLACCLDRAEIDAERIMRQNTGLNVEVAEIWSPFLDNEPELNIYPELHETCRMQGDVA